MASGTVPINLNKINTKKYKITTNISATSLTVKQSDAFEVV